MIGTPILKDVFKYKAKFMANFTSTQVKWGLPGLAVIILMMFIFPWNYNASQILQIFGSALLRALPALPFFLLGFVTPYGITLTTFIKKALKPYFQSPVVRKGEDKSTMPAMVRKRSHPMKVKRSKKYKAIM